VPSLRSETVILVREVAVILALGFAEPQDGSLPELVQQHAHGPVLAAVHFFQHLLHGALCCVGGRSQPQP